MTMKCEVLHKAYFRKFSVTFLLTTAYRHLLSRNVSVKTNCQSSHAIGPPDVKFDIAVIRTNLEYEIVCSMHKNVIYI